jgi:hypothetical protein
MRVAVATVLILLAAAPGAAAQRVKDSPDLWATVNVCDTEARPNTIGIRGSMPGLGRRASLHMRFRVQYLARADGKWHNIAKGADSRWVRLGRSKDRVLESGWSFEFEPPAGGSHTLRGAVVFQWRVRGRTVRTVRELTEGGHRSTAGADPPGFSAATCRIS